MYDTRMTSALTGATIAQLRFWRKPGATGPRLAPSGVVAGHRALYSFEDVVALRMFVSLRQRTSLQRIRKAVTWLREMHPQTHLSAHRLKAAHTGRTIVWLATDGDYIDVVEQPGHQGFPVVMEEDLQFVHDRGRARGSGSVTGVAFSRSIDQAATSRAELFTDRPKRSNPAPPELTPTAVPCVASRLDRPQLPGALRHPAVGEQLHALAVRGGGVGAGRDGGRGVRRRPAGRGGLCRGRGDAEGAGGDRDRLQAVEAHSGQDSSWMAAPTSAPCRRARGVPDRSVARRAPRRAASSRARNHSSPSIEKLGTMRSSQRGNHQFALAEQHHHRRARAGSARSSRRPPRRRAMPTPNCLTVGSPMRMNAKKTLTMISAAEVITRPVVPMPSMTAVRVVARALPGLLDVRHQEHLVVHREAEEDREHHQRHEADDRDLAVEPDEPARPSPSRTPRLTTPNAAPIETRFIRPAVSGMTSERNASSSSTKLSATTTHDRQHEPARDLVGEVDVARGRAADVRRSCPCPSSPPGSCRRAARSTRSLGRLVRRRGRRRRGDHRRGALVVDERLR